MALAYKRILCPIDFDNNSLAALDAAVGLALEADGVVYVLHVVPMIVLGPETGGYIELYDMQTQAARTQLEAIARRKLSSVKHELLIAVGEPAGAILSSTKRLNPDLVVMATHGRKGLAHMFLGSVAERVLRECSKPVLTVRPAPGAKRAKQR
ncbi:MAG: universal stress protein [Candidatus Binataceae bacterium]